MAAVPLIDAATSQDGRTTRCFYLAGIAILSYDHLLTLGSEVTLIWKAGLKRSSMWYLFVRYFTLCSNIAMISRQFGTFDSETCYKVNATHAILIVVQQFLVACTLILRVVAMYSFDKRVVLTLATAAIVIVAVAGWCVVPGTPHIPYEASLPGCETPVSKAQNTRQSIAWEAQLAGDLLVLGFTLYHGYTRTRSEIFRYGTLWRVLVRESAIYFGIICLANLANILVFHLAAIARGSSLSLSAFTSALSVAMICRLMLNLHEAGARQMGVFETTVAPMDTIRFSPPEMDSQIQTEHTWRGIEGAV
ncbi:hypothetical protein B0H11DRAFT_1955372 [Mycena galericulata]|nr:hypothetical protein B0H11DRAFT_1955372 [Mycena galericulata]